MPSLTRYLIVIALLTGAMLFAALHEREPVVLKPATTSEAASRQPPSTSTNTLDEPQVITGRWPTTTASLPTPPPMTKPPQDRASAASLPPDRPENPERTNRQTPGIGEREQHLDDALAQQGYDASWALAKEDSLRHTLQGAAEGYLQIGAVTCRTTFCRIEIDHDSVADQARFIAAMASRPDFVPDGESRHLHQETTVDGKARLRFYLAREGAALPLRG